MFPKSQHLQKVLRNILRCSFYRATGKLHYPSSILPRTCFKNHIDIDSLVVGQHVYFIRRSDKVFDETFDKVGDTYILKEEALEYKEIPGLSLNLFGGRFKEKHLKFKINMHSDANLPWDGESEVFLSDHLNNYSTVEEFSPIFIASENIHQLQIPYSKPADQNLERRLKALGIDQKPTDNKYYFQGTIKFVPSPLNLNYWHCELKVYDFENKSINYDSKKNWIKELCKQIMQDVIAVNSTPHINPLVTIRQAAFKKGLQSRK